MQEGFAENAFPTLGHLPHPRVGNHCHIPARFTLSPKTIIASLAMAHYFRASTTLSKVEDAPALTP